MPLEYVTIGLLNNFRGNFVELLQNVKAIAREDDGKAHGESLFSPLWSSEKQRGAIASELSPTTRTSCAVIYRPYLRPANCLFKHNKTAMPPFNLRRALFRVRSPFRFSLVLSVSLSLSLSLSLSFSSSSLHTHPINVSSFLSSILCDTLYPGPCSRLYSFLLRLATEFPSTHQRLTLRSSTLERMLELDSSKKPRCI